MHLFEYITPEFIIKTLGLVGVVAVIFAESGLFFGFFLPGDSLLFTAGFIASQGLLPIGILLFASWVAAVVGDGVGYSFGKFLGAKLYSRPDSRWFKKEHVERARAFYEKYGSKAIVLARFIPVVRTFAPIVAGAAGMNYRRFLTYNVIGGLIWTYGLGGLGYFFGNTIPHADEYITLIVVLIIVVSLIPVCVHVVKSRVSRG